MAALTKVEEYFDSRGRWWAKRDDLGAYTNQQQPSGCKVRQFVAMLKATPRPAVVLVGSSANSAMPIYIAATAKRFGVPGIVYVPARAKRSGAVAWAAKQGAEIVEVRPGYLSVVRSRARQRKEAELAAGRHVVQWDVVAAIKDTMRQCTNLPMQAPQALRRVVVPTGSGLTAAGVMAGLAEMGWAQRVRVVAVAVSGMAKEGRILDIASQYTTQPLPDLELLQPRVGYDVPLRRRLPNGTRLDEYYAAKALDFIRGGDCLWVSGLRPEASV